MQGVHLTVSKNWLSDVFLQSQKLTVTKVYLVNTI